MKRTKIDIKSSPRQSHFEFFSGFGWPFLDVCARVDMTEALENRPPSVGVFALCLHRIMAAVHQVPELMQRIEPDGVWQYDSVTPSFTVMGENGVFNYAVAEWDAELESFSARVKKAAEYSNTKDELNLEDDHRADLVFVTCLPWLDFTSIAHPRPMGPAPNPADASVPRIAWGKIVEHESRKSMSVALSAHHGLVDGAHLARFYEVLTDEFA